MSEYKKCPYCGHKISGAEYKKVVQKVEAEVGRQVSDERERLHDERLKLKELQRSARAEAREWAESEITEKTQGLRDQIARLKEARQQARDEGVETGREQTQRKLNRAHKKIVQLERQLSNRSTDELGEMTEEDLHGELKRVFTDDKIERLPKSDGGSDVLHRVCYRGKVCGAIVYECKNQKAWQNKWCAQAKHGAEHAQAQHAVIVSATFPKGAKGFAVVKGVPVVAPTGAIAFARVLREALIEMERSGLSIDERAEKSKVLYEYLRGTQFRANMEAIVDAAKGLRDLQDRERKAHQLVWTKQTEEFKTIIDRVGQVQGHITALLEGTLVAAKAEAAKAAASV